MPRATVTKRQIVRIDEELCNGCGRCVTPCAEQAIVLVNGKARVIRDELCDGAGFCLAVCPTGALAIEEREAMDFDEKAVEQRRLQTMIEETAAKKKAETLQCAICGRSEEDAPLIAIRDRGTSRWVCVKCLPSLIHG